MAEETSHMSPRMRTALGGCSLLLVSAHGRHPCGEACTMGHQAMLDMRDQKLSA